MAKSPILTRGERLQIVQACIDADRKQTMPGPALAVRIVDALRDAEEDAVVASTARARSDRVTDFREGERVIVHYLLKPPIHARFLRYLDEHWIEVREDTPWGAVDFVALANRTTRTPAPTAEQAPVAESEGQTTATDEKQEHTTTTPEEGR